MPDSPDNSAPEDEQERCPVCETSLALNDVGTPESCENHHFCVTCIHEWSKVNII